MLVWLKQCKLYLVLQWFYSLLHYTVYSDSIMDDENKMPWWLIMGIIFMVLLETMFRVYG